MSVTLALPSKGRLKDEAIARLEKAGYRVTPPKDDRSYSTSVDGHPAIDVKFISASEIARELEAGNVDLGVTGEDLIRETIPEWERKVAIRARLGFGRADVIVAVPDVWFDVSTMAAARGATKGFRLFSKGPARRTPSWDGNTRVRHGGIDACMRALPGRR